ncbi:SAM-dependent methyltransferase [Paenibacillus hexagrammi]|uniref:SAM-dependent methyltransferase n=1 Tax=Paenibacillus hexagrammi TaxID=2908839 RepID=A0ABY3SS22_9BACL|nr:SAM-dependent methyltransferase [Paenibacillus sp. YPD9-1]UJF35961.1 SAM-dependent methyltransferase [Paenibacillus sp. YPD9-1]
MTTTVTCIGTSNHGFAQYAQEEIRRLFPAVAFKLIVPTEIFSFEVPGSWSEVSAALKEQEPIFLRHVQPVQVQWDLTRSDEDIANLKTWLATTGESGFTNPGQFIAVQVRKEEKADVPYAPFTIKAELDTVITSTLQAEPVVKGADRIVSVYISANKLFAGISSPSENLSDWSGGAIRFQKEEDQISRAKFKLLEAEQRFGIDFSYARAALDIGAAPGGWTSLLLERGLRVTAIDPASMHPSLTSNPMLKIYKKNAGDVKLRDNEFDLLVCDMSWSPRQMGRLVADLLYALQSGGTAIITVKLMHKKPFQTIRELIQLFEPSLHLLKAKQLFHNREELTLYLQKL